MTLDRHSIMRTDFPMSRRGYDRIAVDRHLDEIAQQVEGLDRPASVGATTSAQVQGILDAAEASAAEMERRAWEDASQVQAAADDAVARAREQVQALAMASRHLRERLDGLLAEVEALEGNLAPLPPVPPAEGQETFDGQDTMAFDPITEDEGAEVADLPAQAPAPAPAPAPIASAAEARFGREGDGREWIAQGASVWSGAGREARESARLIALNMADGGQPREATDAYLADLYPPAERAALLDEIYRGR